jgi:glycogen operon protein
MLAQGVPMLLAGDELGHSQQGNNNAYAQDNETTWINWDRADPDLTAFVARLTALRRAHPVLRQKRFLHARPRAADGLPDVTWRRADGGVPRPEDWHDPAFRCLGVELRHAAEDGGTGTGAEAIFAVFNSGAERDVVLPHTAPGWRLILDTTRPAAEPAAAQAMVAAPAHSVLLFEAVTSSGPALEGTP